MQPNMVNATQLLISFLGSEQARIGKEIAASDFSGELAKQMEPPDGVAKVSRRAPLMTLRTGSKSAQESRPRADALPAKKAAKPAEKKDPPAGKCRSAGRAVRPRAAKALSDAKGELYITNPALAEKVLADLQLPAETIKACKNLQDGQGRISVGSYASLLASRQDSAGQMTEGSIGADTARDLLASIVRGQTAQGGGTASSGTADGTAGEGLQVNAEGCSVDGLRALVDQVVQQAAGKDLATAGSGAASLAGGTGANTGDPADPNALAEKAGLTERLAANHIPAFAETGENKTGESSSVGTAAATSKDLEQMLKTDAPAPAISPEGKGKAPSAQAAGAEASQGAAKAPVGLPNPNVALAAAAVAGGDHMSGGAEQVVSLESLSGSGVRMVEMSGTAEGPPVATGAGVLPAEKNAGLMQDLLVFQKEINKPFSGGDQLPVGNTHATGSGLRPDLMSLPSAASSGGDNSSAPDSFRNLDLFQQLEEQWKSRGGAQMLLEIEQEQFGSMVLRVGTRRHEVSAMIVTSDESARDHLVRNTGELRRDLEEQGMALGKFLVDVQKEKSGNGKWQAKEETRGENTSAGGKIDSVQANAARPSHAKAADNLISLIA